MNYYINHIKTCLIIQVFSCGLWHFSRFSTLIDLFLQYFIFLGRIFLSNLVRLAVPHGGCGAGKTHAVTTSHLKSHLILFRVELASHSGDCQTTAAVNACVQIVTCMVAGPSLVIGGICLSFRDGCHPGVPNGSRTALKILIVCLL